MNAIPGTPRTSLSRKPHEPALTATPPVTRFAPSPSGFMHLGHAYAALFAWDAARRGQGRFLLRIEDIDRARSRQQFTDAIFEDLAWLGLDWDGPVRVQSEHMADYAAALARLDELGVIYPCFCTRRAIRDEIKHADEAPHGPDGPAYPGTCRALGADERRQQVLLGKPHAWRLDVAKALDITGPIEWHDRAAGSRRVDLGLHGDVVVARKDVPTSYHLAVTIDDCLQGVTLVTRGDDLVHATGVHRLLQALLGIAPPVWHHHALITDSNGVRLAKRNRAMTLRALRRAGHSPAQVRAMVGFP
jgi:glutamyl-Q tRNA(Asp) synthetase